jgi:hypothetical protein
LRAVWQQQVKIVWFVLAIRMAYALLFTVTKYFAEEAT